MHPTAGFVVKTHRMVSGDKGDKVWVNIVTATQCDEPTSKALEGGQQWSLPHSVGPPRMEKDKKGGTVTTFDCCFHPKVLAIASRHPQGAKFRELIVNTAAVVIRCRSICRRCRLERWSEELVLIIP